MENQKKEKKNMKNGELSIKSDQIRLDCTWVYKIRENSEIFKDWIQGKWMKRSDLGVKFSK
jgi:hypothetical protein